MIFLKTVYLVRHGIVKKYPDEDVLGEKGILFSENLHLILKDEKIDFIAYVKGKKRCYDTIKHLEKIYVDKASSYTKAEFNMKFPLPLNEALKHDTAIICYGKSEKKSLFKFFKICPKDDDYTYEVIYKINFFNNDFEEIQTGYSKIK